MYKNSGAQRKYEVAWVETTMTKQCPQQEGKGADCQLVPSLCHPRGGTHSLPYSRDRHGTYGCIRAVRPPELHRAGSNPSHTFHSSRPQCCAIEEKKENLEEYQRSPKFFILWWSATEIILSHKLSQDSKCVTGHWLRLGSEILPHTWERETRKGSINEQAWLFPLTTKTASMNRTAE